MTTVTGRNSVELKPLMELDVGQPIEYFRSVPLSLGAGAPKAFLSFYSANYDIDAGIRMFCYPTDTLKMMVYTDQGEVLWRRDLGPGVVPGNPFCNFFAFDLDGDGVDEIWFVNNLDQLHPFNLYEYVLERVNPFNGETTGQWPWPHDDDTQSLSHQFRNHLFGGYVKGEPVLITAQGTYGPMFFQAWRPDMTHRWVKAIGREDPGARGSHVFPVLDINHDGIDEFMWAERCIEMDTGNELFCADRDTWTGHSDMVQPIFNPSSGRWAIYVNRETNTDEGPRVILYNDQGERIWGAVERGHIHKGWVGRIGPSGELVATAGKIDGQTKSLEGRYYTGVEEYTFDALTGKPVQLPYSTFDTAPIDLNGDGYHEIVRGVAGGDARVMDRFGNSIKEIGGRITLCSKIVDHPGEQLLSYYREGMVRLWADVNAQDTPEAIKRYAHPFYKMNQKSPTKEYIMCMLGGI